MATLRTPIHGSGYVDIVNICQSKPSEPRGPSPPSAPLPGDPRWRGTSRSTSPPRTSPTLKSRPSPADSQGWFPQRRIPSTGDSPGSPADSPASPAEEEEEREEREEKEVETEEADILYVITSYHIILHYIVLYWNILYRIMLSYSLLHMRSKEN